MPSTRFFKGPYVQNIGISYSGGTFTIAGADGRALSASNPGVVTIPSQTTAGEFVRIDVTANQDFIDDAGASEIIGNLFGLTTSIAYASDVPFFIYAVPNDAETLIQFMISRIPHARISPAAANIGAPDDAVADAEADFWSLQNIDETLFDANPCFSIGSFRMTMSASDDWTVQTIESKFDGIGNFQEDAEFSVVAGHFGAASGKFFKDNSGTAPGFVTNASVYSVTRDGFCNFTASHETVNVDGVGAVQTILASPFISNTSVTKQGVFYYFDSSAGVFHMGTGIITSGANVIKLLYPGYSASAFITNAEVDSSDQIVGTIHFKISES